MGNSNSSSKAAAVTVAVAVAVATTTAVWVLSSYLSSENVESQNRSSATVEFQSESKETMKDLNIPHVDVNNGASPIYETKASLSVQDIRRYFQLKEISKQKAELHDRISWRSEAKQKSKAEDNKQIPKHLIPNSYNHIQDIRRHFQLKEISKQKVELHDRISWRLEAKQKSKAEDNKQILKHLIPNSFKHKTIKIMSYNIWSIKYYKRETRMNAVNYLIEQHSPDIILLQEVTPEVYIYFQSCNWWDIYECSIKEEQCIKQFFCMMLSKLPVNKFYYKHFVNTKTSKGLSVAKLTSLTVATCHLKSPDGACTYGGERTSQAKEAIKLLRFLPNVVLGGDMNWDESTDGPFPLTSGWCDAWSDLKPEEDGYTYDTESNAMLGGRRSVVQKRLDRFVCRLKDFNMIDIEIVGKEAIEGVSYKSNGGKKLPLLPSDHYGLILTICAK